MTYIATADIEAAPGVLAFKKGDIVPASAVKNLKAETKVAEAAKAAPAAPEAPKGK
jgi:hypothetical protein